MATNEKKKNRDSIADLQVRFTPEWLGHMSVLQKNDVMAR